MKIFENKVLAFSLIFLLAGAIGIYVRLYPLFHLTSSDASEKATVLVLTKLKSVIAQKVEEAYPELTSLQKKQIAEREFDTILRKEGGKARASIERLSQTIEDTSKEKHTPYLLASDSYYYFRLSRNIERTGRLAETIKGSKYLNKLMLAPLGQWEPLNLHPYAGFLVYKAAGIFKPGISLMYGVAFTPLLVTVLALLAFLIICSIFRFSGVVTFVSAVFFLMAPIFVKRSTFGWYDNDPYNTLFPLIILTVLFAGLSRVKTPKESTPWAFFLSLSVLFYAFFWHGWVYVFSVVFISGVLIVLSTALFLKRREETKHFLYYFGTAFLGTLFLTGLILGPKEFFTLFNEGLTALKNFIDPQVSLWPDMYIGVGELKKAPLSEIISLTGGYFFFITAAFGLVSGVIRAAVKKDAPALYRLIVLTVFLCLSVFITLGAQRFALLCLIPLSLLFPVGLQNIYELGRRYIPAGSELQKKIITAGFVVLGLALGFFPVRQAQTSVRSLLNPIFNETWETALNEIREKTPPESIVNTWWPPGHFITAIAGRRVTFDGASINNPQAYWMAKVFLSTDEKEAAGILRMLNDSANEACAYLRSQGFSLPDAVKIIENIAPLNKDQARQSLSGRLSKEQTARLLSLTHAPAPPSYLLVYSELVEKSLQLDFVAKWDFKKMEDIRQDQAKLKSVPPRHSKEYINFLWKLTGGPYKVSAPLSEIGRSAGTVLFEENVRVNLNDMSVMIASDKFGAGIPKNIFYVKGDEVLEKGLPNATLNYSVVLTEESGRYTCILMDEPMARSLLVRLFYFKGKGLKYFKPFLDESDLTRRTRILAYKIDTNE